MECSSDLLAFLVACGEFAGALVNLTLRTLPLTSGVGLFTLSLVHLLGLKIPEPCS